jgi:hypothetical protein
MWKQQNSRMYKKRTRMIYNSFKMSTYTAPEILIPSELWFLFQIIKYLDLWIFVDIFCISCCTINNAWSLHCGTRSIEICHNSDIQNSEITLILWQDFHRTRCMWSFWQLISITVSWKHKIWTFLTFKAGKKCFGQNAIKIKQTEETKPGEFLKFDHWCTFDPYLYSSFV